MSKIFHIISSIQLGGAEIVAFDLAAFCYKANGRKYDSTIVELYSTDNDYAKAKKEELSNKGIRVLTLFNGSKRSSLLISPFKLASLIKKEEPKIIHSHTDLPDLVLSGAIRILKLEKRKIGIIFRTIHNTQLWRTHFKMGKCAESEFRNDVIIGVSISAIEAYKKLRLNYKLPVSNDINIIYNGCHIPKLENHPFKIKSSKINIAFCGRFEDYKGMDTLIYTINKTGNKLPGVFEFHIIGDGTFKSELVELSKQHNNVTIYPPTANISNKLYDFDFVFMPSKFEGLGLVSVEASLSKVPVIASFAPGLDETLPDNWPLRFNLNDEEKLYDIFNKISIGYYDIGKLKEIAFEYAKGKFSMEKMISSYSSLYNKNDEK